MRKTVRILEEFRIIGFGCILGEHLGSGGIIGWKGPPALLDRWHCCFSVSVFLSLFSPSSGTTIIRCLFTSSPGSLHLTAWSELPRAEICLLAWHQLGITFPEIMLLLHCCTLEVTELGHRYTTGRSVCSKGIHRFVLVWRSKTTVNSFRRPAKSKAWPNRHWGGEAYSHP